MYCSFLITNTKANLTFLLILVNALTFPPVAIELYGEGGGRGLANLAERVYSWAFHRKFRLKLLKPFCGCHL